jgi:hypothetical protein
MSLDRTKTAIDAFKPFAKLIPVAGGPVEGFVDLLSQGCAVAQVYILVLYRKTETDHTLI